MLRSTHLIEALAVAREREIEEAAERARRIREAKGRSATTSPAGDASRRGFAGGGRGSPAPRACRLSRGRSVR